MRLLAHFLSVAVLGVLVTGAAAAQRMPQETGGILLAQAQTFAVPELGGPSGTVRRGTGARLRALDTISGRVSDIDVAIGDVAQFGRLNILLRDCRYPADNPAAEAYAQLVISDAREDRVFFSGWMIASSPALSAMEHPRYDAWVLSCITSSTDNASD